MAATNGNGAGYTAPKLPTIEELRRAYDEGLPQTLLSGIEVYMRPVRPDKLLASGKVPDILTPLVMNMMFPPDKVEDDVVFPDEVNSFLGKPRDKTAEAIEFVKAVDVVCEAALIDATAVPYLSLSDRLWIFKLAFMPVEVLSTFRLQPKRDVGVGDSSTGEPQPPERDDAGDSGTVPVESTDSISVR